MEQTFNYANRTYATIREDLLSRASNIIPEWTDRDPSDFGMLLVDLWSYMGDVLHYYVDRAGREAFITTATQRESLLAYANMFGYKPSGRESANATVYVSNSSSASTYTLPSGSSFSGVSDNTRYYFYTPTEVTINPGGTTAFEVFEGTQIKDEVLTSSSLGIPNQAYTLKYSDVSISSIDVSVTEDGVVTPWVTYPSIQDMPQGARGYAVRLAASGDVQIGFGNRISGFIPPAGSTITVSYTRCSGANGNIGSNLINSFVTAQPSALTITSSSSATGGTNGETADILKSNIVSYLRTQDRAVTLKDYEDITKSVNGVYKAVASYTPSTVGSSAAASVNIYALPFVSDFLTTSSYSISVPQTLRNSITDRLSSRTMLGVTPVPASTLTLNRLDIALTVYIADGFVSSWVKSNVQNAIDGLLSFNNTEFGKMIRKSDVYKAIMDLSGVDYVDISTFEIRDSSNALVTTLDPVHLLRKGTVTITASGGMVTS